MRCLVGLLLVASAGCGRLNFGGVAATDANVSGDDAPAGGDGGGGVDALPGDMVEVPVTPGPFDFSPGSPWKQVSLSRSFALDRHEVTVGRWQAWVAAGMPTPSDNAMLDVTSHYQGMRWDNAWDANVKQMSGFTSQCASPWTRNGSTYPTGNAALPMNCITWHQAVAFCAWDGGKRLPTVVEWNYEARGGTGGVGDHRPYAWGTATADCAHATFASGADNFCNWPVPVGTASAGLSAHGVADMNGSLWEFLWDSTSQPGLGAVAGEVPAASVDWIGLSLGVDETVTKVIAGGEWGEPETDLNLISGSNHSPGEGWGGNTILTTIGLRCARTL